MAVEDRIVNLYRGITRDLATMLGTAQRGASQEFIRAQLTALSRQLERVSAAEAQWVRENIPAEYRRSAGQAQLTLKKADVPISVSRFTGVDERAVTALATRISTDLSDVRSALSRGLALQDPRLGMEAVEAALRGDNRFVTMRAGVPRIRVPSGRLWRLDAYSRMLSRTVIADSRRVAFRQRYLQNNTDRVRVVETGTVHDICKVWEGRALSLTGATEGLPTVDDAFAAGLFHPHCRHRYVVDTTQDRPELSDEEAEALQAEADVAEGPLPILGRRPAGSRRPSAPRGVQ